MGYENKKVVKIRREQRTRKVLGGEGYVTETYWADVPYETTETVWVPDTSSSSSSYDSGSSGGGYSGE